MKRKERDPEARAIHLLSRMDAGEVGAILAYADLAQAPGWPCYGYASWTAWAADVTTGLLERKTTPAGARVAALERDPLPVQVAQVYQQAYRR